MQFSQVWESPDEAIGSMHYLVVSSDAYNDAFGDRRAIAVEIDSRAVFEGIYRDPSPTRRRACLAGAARAA